MLSLILTETVNEELLDASDGVKQLDMDDCTGNFSEASYPSIKHSMLPCHVTLPQMLIK